jgi:hypothetical protein
MIICYVSFNYRKKEVFIREKQSAYVVASVVLEWYLRGDSIEIRPPFHL